MTQFKDKLDRILSDRNISRYQFCFDTGINRQNFFYRKRKYKHGRHIYMAIAYYLGMDVEDLVSETDAEIDWYGDEGI